MYNDPVEMSVFKKLGKSLRCSEYIQYIPLHRVGHCIIMDVFNLIFNDKSLQINTIVSGNGVSDSIRIYENFIIYLCCC